MTTTLSPAGPRPSPSTPEPSPTTERSPGASPPRRGPLAVAMLVTTGALTVLNRVRMRRELVDLQVYRKGAWAFLHGRSPYAAGLPGPHLPYTYTPFSTVAFAPMSVLPLHAAMIAHTFVSLAALFVGLALVIRELDGRGTWNDRVVLVAIAATVAAYWSEPVSQTLGFGQINLVLLGMVLVDLLAVRDRPGGGVLVGIAAGIKLTPLIFVAYLLLTGRRRQARNGALAAATTVVLGWFLLPGPSARYFLHLVFDDRRIGAPGFVANQSLNGFWVRAAHGYEVSRPLWALSAAVVLALGLWTARQVHRRTGEPAGVAVTAITGLLVSPISWSHHWVWFAVVALVLGWTAWQRRSALLAVATVAWSIPFYVGPFWLIAHRNYRRVPPVGWQRPLADAYTLVGLAALLAVATYELVLLRRDRHGTGEAGAAGRRTSWERASDPGVEPSRSTPTALGSTLIVVPTLDESANIERLLGRIRRVVPSADVLVVDDGSIDGTPELAEQLGRSVGGVAVWRRTDTPGLGPAYRAGFGRALADGYDVVAQMDADLSHDPADLPALLDAIREGADVAIGSRYVPGGATPGWPRRRRLLSRAGGAYARVLLGLDVRDPTSGFRAYRAHLLERIDLGTVRSTGFAFQIEMTDRARQRGASVVEVPITFRDRTAGSSKMSPAIAAEALALVTRTAVARLAGPLLSRRHPDGRPNLAARVVRCLGVSAVTTILSLVLIVAGTAGLGMAAMTANVAATAIATVPSYSLNRRWTWGRVDRSDLWREVVPFWVLSFCGLALSTITVGMADSWAARTHLAPVLHTTALLVGHLGGFGLLWVAQFAILDRVLFAPSGAASTPTTSPVTSS